MTQKSKGYLRAKGTGITGAGHPDFIQLDRKFKKLEADEFSEHSVTESYAREGQSFDEYQARNWDQMLASDIAIVLAEPGSGKTWEFREQAIAQQKKGTFAFYVRLDVLIYSSFEDAIGANMSMLFKRWLNTSKTGLFFVDSVDEAKINSVSDFHHALAKLAEGLNKPSAPEAKIIISSRISDWNPENDEGEVLRILSRSNLKITRPERMLAMNLDGGQQIESVSAYGQEENERIARLDIYRLLPLNREQISKLAKAEVEDANKFIESIKQSHAWSFATRPIDVKALIGYWKGKGGLGTLTQIIEFDLNRKLEPPLRDIKDPISKEKARDGLEYLAAATVFCRLFNFRVPDHASKSNGAIEVSECLPHWQQNEIKALMNRPIFDSASYGCIRFHHRRTSEYLAASWLKKRMAEGCSQTELKNLLFSESGPSIILRPSLAPVAGWLLSGSEPWNARVREWIMLHSPSNPLLYGDPSALPIEFRRELLKRICDLGGPRNIGFLSSPAHFRRLADERLSEEIVQALEDKSISDRAKIVLVSIVGYGGMTKCLPCLNQLIESSGISEELQYHCALAIGNNSDEYAKRRLVSWARSLIAIDQAMCAILAETCYPSVMPGADLALLIKKVQADGESLSNLDDRLQNLIKEVGDNCDLAELISNLLEFISSKSGEGLLGAGITSNYLWFSGALVEMVRSLLRRSKLEVGDAKIVAIAISSLEGLSYQTARYGQELSEFNSLTKRHEDIRKDIFFELIKRYRNQYKKEPEEVYDLFKYEAIIRIDGSDLNWLVKLYHDHDDRNDKIIILKCVFQAISVSDSKLKNLIVVLFETENDAKLRHLRFGLLKKEISKSCRRAKRYFLPMLSNKYWWISKGIKLNELKSRIRLNTKILVNIRKLRSGEMIRWLEGLSAEADNESRHQWTVYRWNDLRKKRGSLITEATREGCRRFWRTYSAPLPHERLNPNETDIRVIVGLRGLQVEIGASPDRIENFTADEASLATRYAVNELNGFPKWFNHLAKVHPVAVGQVLFRCIEGEWEQTGKQESIVNVVGALTWADIEIFRIVADKVLILLRKIQPESSLLLERSLSLLLNSQQFGNATICELAEYWIEKETFGSERFVVWIVLLLKLRAERAIEILNSVLLHCEDADQLMVSICSSLVSRRGGTDLVDKADYLSGENLFKLILLVFKFVRKEDDLVHYGGYTPTDRDDAQDLRNSLLPALADCKCQTAPYYLNALLSEPLMANYGNFITRLIEQRRERDAELGPWEPSQIYSFVKQQEFDPVSNKELFAIALKRIKEIKDDVEKAEVSLRTELHSSYQEIELRKWLHRKLSERSRNRYKVPEEVEIDLGQRPDLRVESPKAGVVSVEVKWCENWNYEELREGLENQLVGQYLRAHNSKYGIYVLGIIGKPKAKKWFDGSNEAALSFDELIQSLKEKAELVEAVQRLNVEGLEVFGIDFRDPRRIV